MKERKNKLKYVDTYCMYNCTSDFSGWTEVANNV